MLGLSDEGARKDLNELVEKNTGFKRKRKKYALCSEVSWRLVGVFLDKVIESSWGALVNLE